MQKLVQLNKSINNCISLKITFNGSVDNYRYGDFWVTNLHANYFSILTKEVLELIEQIIDYDDVKHVSFLKVIFKDLITTLENGMKSNFEDFDSLQQLISSNELIFPDEYDGTQVASELEQPSPANNYDDRAEYIIEIVKGFFTIHIEDTVDAEELNRLLIEKYNVPENDLEKIYASAHLSYIISLHYKFVRNIAIYIKETLDLLQKLQDSLNDNILLSNEISNSIDGVKLEFAMSKLDIAILFHALHELKIIKTDIEDIHNSQTKLKAFIDNSNIYYKFKSKLTKVENIKKEFVGLNNKEINSKEIEFIKNLIGRLTTRINEIEQR